ncbi:WD40 repeat domain-containing protein [Endozoicomonas sp.]|nr:WD40 repeat domain-containing protein [Endozoicomonas sp.]
MIRNNLPATGYSTNTSAQPDQGTSQNTGVSAVRGVKRKISDEDLTEDQVFPLKQRDVKRKISDKHLAEDQVFPLTQLPAELICDMAIDYLQIKDFFNLQLTSTYFRDCLNDDHLLHKQLAKHYYGNKNASVDLLNCAQYRFESNQYLRSLGYNTEKICKITLQQEQTDIISDVIQLADGRLATRSRNTVKIWDLDKPEGERCVATLRGHGYISACRQLANGRLATCSHDETVKIWDLDKPELEQCVATLRGDSAIDDVFQLADGRLATRLRDTVKIWDLGKPEDQQCVATLRGDSAINDVFQLADGRLATRLQDTVKIWDLDKPEDEQCVATLRGHTCLICDLIQLADGRLATCSGDKTVKIWNPDKPVGEQCVSTLNGHTLSVYSVRQLADGLLVTTSEDKTVKIWNPDKPEGKQCVTTLEGHGAGSTRDVIQLADGRLATNCSSDKDKTVKIWDLKYKKKCVAILRGHKEWVGLVRPLADGRLATMSDDKTVKIWDLKAESEPCGNPPGTYTRD